MRNISTSSTTVCKRVQVQAKRLPRMDDLTPNLDFEGRGGYYSLTTYGADGWIDSPSISMRQGWVHAW